MKHLNIYLILLFISFSQLVNGQQHSAVLNGNSIAATTFDRGRLFQYLPTNAPGYEMPAGSGNHLIYMANFWFGGTNQHGDLKLASDKFASDMEFYRGPYSSTNSYYDTAYMSKYQSGIWNVSKSEIIYHIDNYNEPGYVAPDGILDWPGNGNPAIGVAQQLAPYVDVNNNGIYEPYEGDYPCIKGDAATYQIMNEDRTHNSSGGEKIGAEIHMMIYQVAADNYIDSTTFIDVTVINKGQNSFNDFRVALYMDPDIGFSEDDYIGSASSKNLMYAYNGVHNDTGQGGAPGYGTNPPAIGVVSLNKGMDYSGYFSRSDLSPTPIMSGPDAPEDYWNLMNGKWLDSSSWTYGGRGYGGTIPTHYIYDGNPYLDTGWTELNIDGNGNSNMPIDRRFFISSDAESFLPGDTLTYSYAIIVNQIGIPLENVQGLFGYADSVQHYFDNTTYPCIQQGTGVTDVFDTEESNLLNFEITRVDGEGNMSRPVMLSPQTEQEVLDSTAVQKITYQRGQGPIQARLTDSIGYPLGHYVLKFNKYDKIDTANWTIYRYDTIGGNLIDSVNSSLSIDVGHEQFIPQWKMAIKIKQMPYVCRDTTVHICPSSNKIAVPITSGLTFTDDNQKWLTGVKNINGMAPNNWIMSGSYITNDFPNDSIHNPACYSSNYYDINNLFTDLAGGIISPGRMARFSDCDLTPIALSSTVGSNSDLSSISSHNLSTNKHPSIDIVFTGDTSKWTRSPVIELNKTEAESLNGGKAGFLRNSPSVNKQGNPDGSGTGMGWFPGYAIDVETGRRLNIAFCENSTMTDDNGDDMIWNPSERLIDDNGNYVLGGQHTIYVFGGEVMGMPNYDEGAFIHQNLQAEDLPGYKKVYANLSWVVQPLQKPGEQLNATDARLKVRINKEFKTRTISNKNEGRPMFNWDVIPYEEVLSTSIATKKTIGEIKIYPNPASEHIVVVWKDVKIDEIKILSFQGKLIKRISTKGVKGEKTIDINGLAPGVYFVNIGSSMHKLIIQ